MSRALVGVRVLEYGTGIGAAYCAALLAELGAEVHKVVEPAGTTPVTDRARVRRQAEELYLDIHKQPVTGRFGSASFLELARGADVIVRGIDPSDGSAKDVRAEYDTCRAQNPDLVFVAASPFGVTGPASGWRGGDLNAQSLSGWTWITGNPGEAPLSMNYGIGALQQGLNAAGAAVAALCVRGGPGGGGEFVDLAEADVIAACIRMYSLTYRFLNINLTRNGHRAPGSSGRYPHTMLACKDGYISTICRSEIDWNRFVEMMGNPAWAAEPRYRDFFKMGTEYPEEVDALVVPWLMRHTKAELGELAVRYRVPLAPVCTIEEALANRQFAHRDFFRVERVGDREVRLPGSVARQKAAETVSHGEHVS